MEAIILIGIQGSGKSTFYQRKFASTHLRISRDVAGSKARERRLMEACLARSIDFVVDNTNATATSREQYIQAAKSAGYRVFGYFFPPDIKAALARNALRSGHAKVPVPGIYRTLKHLAQPALSEGFDELYQVRVTDDDFSVGPFG